MQNIVAIIPARGGSKGIPKKELAQNFVREINILFFIIFFGRLVLFYLRNNLDSNLNYTNNLCNLLAKV